MIKKIGILGAMPQEVNLILNSVKDFKKENISGIDFYSAKKDEKEVIVCCGGMGKVNAACSTQVLISHFSVDAIIFSGIAGNMSDEITIGDVVVSETLCYHDAEDHMLAKSAPDTSLYTADSHLIKAACYACEAVGVNFIVGKIATGDQFIGDPETKQKIKEKCNPDCVEMEGAAVAQTCMRNNIPFVVLRAMSDNSNTSLADLKAISFDIEKYVETASAIVLAMLNSI